MLHPLQRGITAAAMILRAKQEPSPGMCSVVDFQARSFRWCRFNLSNAPPPPPHRISLSSRCSVCVVACYKVHLGVMCAVFLGAIYIIAASESPALSVAAVSVYLSR